MGKGFGKCRVCERKDALHKCSVCGRPVCSEHFVSSRNICVVCFETICESCGKGLSIGYCCVCGKVCCEDCLIQVSLTKYICKSCYHKKSV